MSIGIAIPACKSYIHYLESLLRNISEQTIIPDEIAISISDIDIYKPKNDYGLNLIIKSFPESKNGAQNRNIAANLLNTDVISFFDCDDLMHPQRTEFLLHSFKDDNVEAVVHDYETEKYIFDNLIGNPYNQPNLEFNVINTIYEDLLYPSDVTKNKRFHNAHVSVRRKIFDILKYDEHFWAPDSLFNKEIVKHGYNISLLKNKLSFYTLR
jgi:hypothetical protein